MKINFEHHCFFFLLILLSCNGDSKTVNTSRNENHTNHHFKVNKIHLIADTVLQLGEEIDCMFQEDNNTFWFGCNGDGLYKYDGKHLLHYTNKHGLVSNFVWSIQQDKIGNIWISTRDGICNFDGSLFTDYTDIINHAPNAVIKNFKKGVCFYLGDRVCVYDGVSFVNYKISDENYFQPNNSNYNPYSIYCSLVDQQGKLWFGTQEKGVAHFDGTDLSYINNLDLAGPAVRAIYEDQNGEKWFGNNGGGFYNYHNGKLINLTKQHRLGNEAFLKQKQTLGKTGTLARVFAINQDRDGQLWIGTADAGVWMYNGSTFKNYSLNDGLIGNRVTCIFKDNKGELWFVCDGIQVCRFDGNKFVNFDFKLKH
jgi:ligand-binding sensor domain-containing protein